MVTPAPKETSEGTLFIRWRDSCNQVFVQQKRSVHVVLAVLTVASWIVALLRWSTVYAAARAGHALGSDLRLSWLAEKHFVCGRDPYKVAGFVYPPSHLILALPLEFVSFQTAREVFLILSIALMIGAVCVASWTVGRRPLGLTAAGGASLLSYTAAAASEARLENMSAAVAFGFAVLLLLATRGKWALAGAVLGLTFAIKPMLIPIPIVFLVARQWKGLGFSIAIPAALNLVGVGLLPKTLPSFLASLPFLVNHSSGHAALNSDISSAARILGWSVAVASVLRLLAFVVTVLAARSARRLVEDRRVRLTTGTSSMLLGIYLFGPLSRDHYMLTLIPLAISATAFASPMRWVTAWLGFAFLMGVAVIPQNILGVGHAGSASVTRGIGLALVLCTVVAALRYRQLARYLQLRRESAEATSGAYPGVGADLTPP